MIIKSVVVSTLYKKLELFLGDDLMPRKGDVVSMRIYSMIVYSSFYFFKKGITELFSISILFLVAAL